MQKISNNDQNNLKTTEETAYNLFTTEEKFS